MKIILLRRIQYTSHVKINIIYKVIVSLLTQTRCETKYLFTSMDRDLFQTGPLLLLFTLQRQRIVLSKSFFVSQVGVIFLMVT